MWLVVGMGVSLRFCFCDFLNLRHPIQSTGIAESDLVSLAGLLAFNEDLYLVESNDRVGYYMCPDLLLYCWVYQAMNEML